MLLKLNYNSVCFMLQYKYINLCHFKFFKDFSSLLRNSRTLFYVFDID